MASTAAPSVSSDLLRCEPDVDTAPQMDAEPGSDVPESLMGELPTELLLQVLSLLPTEALSYGGAVRNVCRRWRRATECASPWRHRDLVWSSSPRDRDLFLRAAVVAPELRAVTFQPGVHVPECILQGCSRVRHLSLTSNGVCPSEDVVLALVQQYSARAETLRLEGNLSRAVSTAVLHAVAACRQLRSLRLAGTLRLPGDGAAAVAVLQALAKGCPGLRELDVERLSDWGPRLVAEVAAAKGTQLTSLVLPGRQSVVDDKVLQLVASSCGGLSALGADYADAVAVVGHLPGLRSLRLWYSYSAPDPVVLHQLAARGRQDAVSANLARLEHLSVELATETKFVELVLGACSSLRSLRLSGDFLARQVDVLLAAAPYTVEHLECCSFSLAGRDAWVIRGRLPRLRAAVLNGVACSVTAQRPGSATLTVHHCPPPE